MLEWQMAASRKRGITLVRTASNKPLSPKAE
jgi:hypothetical protein